MSNPLLGLLILTFFGSFLLFVLLASFMLRRKNRLEKRLEHHLSYHSGEESKKKGTSDKKPLQQFLHIFSESIEGASFLKHWKLKLLQAGIGLTAAEFFILRLFTGLGFMSIGYLYGLSVWYFFPLATSGYLLPRYFVGRRLKKRLDRCSYQLGEALGTMANAMRAGFSFMQAMKMISDEFPDPIGPEFKQVLRDINYGVPVEKAFEDLLKRLPHKDLEMVIQSLLIQRTSGGNLANLLETTQSTVHGRTKVKEELNTLTAQGKMSSWIITAIPILLAVYLQLVNPEYFNQLTGHPLGWVMLGFGGFNIILGWFVIRKIIQIEV